MSASAPAVAEPAVRTAGRRRALVLVPPEGVPVSLALPSLGTRVAAQVIDLVLTLLATGLLVTALVLSGAAALEAESAVLALIALLVGTPLYMACELLMNGRTPGKRLTGIRVVSLDGTGLSVHQIVVRNLLKEVEIFLPLLAAGRMTAGLAALAWILVVVAVPVRSRARQRIGDLAAGTVVVAQPDARLLPDLAAAPAHAGAREGERFPFTSAQLELYGAYELQVLERLLRERTRDDARGSAPPDQAALAQVSASIRGKIGYGDAVPAEEAEAFLLAFYRAQRAFLEQKRLFGEARRDKFHRASGAAPTGER